MEDSKNTQAPANDEHYHAAGSMPATAGEEAQADPNPMPAEEHHDRITGEDTAAGAGEGEAAAPVEEPAKTGEEGESAGEPEGEPEGDPDLPPQE